MFKKIRVKLKQRKIRRQKEKEEHQKYMDFIYSKREYNWKELCPLDTSPTSYNDLTPEQKMNQKGRIIELEDKAVRTSICPICGEDLKTWDKYSNNGQAFIHIYTKYYCSSLDCDYCQNRSRG